MVQRQCFCAVLYILPCCDNSCLRLSPSTYRMDMILFILSTVGAFQERNNGDRLHQEGLCPLLQDTTDVFGLPKGQRMMDHLLQHLGHKWSGVRVSETKSETQEELARGFSKIKCSSSKRGKGKERECTQTF